MYNAAIIGAGQLGSRHLQGLKTASLPFKIWVMDKSVDSLNIAKQRYDSVQAIGEKEISLVTDISQLPENLDFVVVATGSLPRASLVKALLSHSQVKYMILEKVLFPKIEDYDVIGRLIEEKGIKCWVNCARRMFGLYHEIEYVLEDEPFEMKYEGSNWGLCCNGIHFIDIFMMLNGEKQYEIDSSHLLPEICESKRKGYIEMYGRLMMFTPKGSKLQLTCFKDSNRESFCEIRNSNHYIIVDEGKGILNIDGAISSFRFPFQSETTGSYADLLLKTGYCSLTPFKESSDIHRFYIKELLDFYNKVTSSNSEILPIT